MLEITLILILVIIAMVAVIVNRKSLLSCFIITGISSLLGLGFLVLYANADKFSSHEKLLSFTITASIITVVILIAVTYIGVKMQFKNLLSRKRYVPAPAQEATGDPMLIPGTNVYAKAVGIFGRKELLNANETPAVAVSPQVAEKPETAQPAPAQRTATAASDMLRRMLDKAESFKAQGQYVLAEQMYVTYISRCPDTSSRADGELLMLDCRILAGNNNGAKEQLTDLLGKLHSGVYTLTPEQKKQLADCKFRMMKIAK